jgi:hypothetical protein
MLKWVRLTEVDKNHMAKTLRAHEIDFDQNKLDQILKEIMPRKKTLNLLHKRLNNMKPSPSFFKVLFSDTVHAFFTLVVTLATIAFALAIPFYFFPNKGEVSDNALVISVSACMTIFLAATLLLWSAAISKYKQSKK